MHPPARSFAGRHRLPSLGVGIGLRQSFYSELPATRRHLDWVEIIPENFIDFGGARRRALSRCRERWPVVPHGVSLSVGGPDPLDRALLTGLRRLTSEMDAPWFSDHLCWSAAGGIQSNDLLPLPFTRDAISHAVPRIRAIADAVERPFVLENPSYYLSFPRPELDEAEFIAEVAERADCGILLDVNNVLVNALNHGYDPETFVDRIPAERIVQMHVAGHEQQGDVVIDTHGRPVPDRVWALLGRAIRRAPWASVLVEWDSGYPSLDAILDEADRARLVVEQARAGIETAPNPAPRATHG